MTVKKIKVTHIITMLERGGAQLNTLYTLSHLDPDRFECQLLCGPGGALDDEALALSSKGFKLNFIPSLIRPIRPWHDLMAISQIKQALKEFKPDIVHTHSSKAGILGRRAAAQSKVPKIVHTFHGFGFNDQQKPWVRMAFIMAESQIAPLADRLIFVSEANQQEAKSLGIGRTEQYALIRSGVSKPGPALSEEKRAQVKRELGVPRDARLVVTIGPFKPQKNISDFIRVAKRVSELEPKSFFVIIGDGEQRPRLETLRNSLGLQSHLFMPGWKKENATTAVLETADVFVMTSLWEGLPRSLVEAMQRGMAVACYDTDGIKDIVRDGENGFLFKPGEIEPMARQIDRVLKHEAMRRQVGQNAKISLGEEFDIDRMVRQQEELYLELMNPSPSSNGCSSQKASSRPYIVS